MSEVILNNYNFAGQEEFDYLDELQIEILQKSTRESNVLDSKDSCEKKVTLRTDEPPERCSQS